VSLFVTFEGIEGSGKSTHLRRLAAHLRNGGHDVLETHEPGGTGLGTAIRRLLLADASDAPTGRAELFLYCADRAQHVAEVVRPALAVGRIVLCDRFSDSTIAYQGYGRALDIAVVRRLDACARDGLMPRQTFLLDCPVSEGLRRVHRRTGAADRLEREDAAFHERIRSGFLTLAAAEPERFTVVDSTRPAETVAAEVARRMDQLLAGAS